MRQNNVGRYICSEVQFPRWSYRIRSTGFLVNGPRQCTFVGAGSHRPETGLHQKSQKWHFLKIIAQYKYHLSKDSKAANNLVIRW